MQFKLALDRCLSQLETNEKAKPTEQRRTMPSIRELADGAGLSHTTLYNMVGGKKRRGANRKLVSLEALSAVVTELNRRGFEVGLTDVVTVEKGTRNE